MFNLNSKVLFFPEYGEFLFLSDILLCMHLMFVSMTST